MNLKINALFDDVKDISGIEDYLTKCGVSTPSQYLKANTIEDSSKYKDIDKAKELILKYINKEDNK